ncbi:hypothetical protein EVAR_101103_1 [Eumeta japonica]|uniref:Uncharacterized protein n=1 Tax=Eumeta variegata TaxID=151549 RepID=A0A4C1TKK1_EUMVA|nr:hypothetical protein EVAR_101103_1 [Eumeta japonica]
MSSKTYADIAVANEKITNEVSREKPSSTKKIEQNIKNKQKAGNIFSRAEKQTASTFHKEEAREYSQIKTSNGGKEAPSNVDTVFITLPCKMAKRGKLVLLVKTGANSSIVKEEAMNVFPGDGILGRDNIWGKSKLDSIRGTLKIFNDNQWVKTFTLHAAHECEAGHQRMACLSKGQRQQYQSIQFLKRIEQWSIGKNFSSRLCGDTLVNVEKE